MTTRKVLEAVAEMPFEDLAEIQQGIADLIVSRFSPKEIAEIDAALAEAEAEFARGDVLTSEQLRKQLGLP